MQKDYIIFLHNWQITASDLHRQNKLCTVCNSVWQNTNSRMDHVCKSTKPWGVDAHLHLGTRYGDGSASFTQFCIPPERAPGTKQIPGWTFWKTEKPLFLSGTQTPHPPWYVQHSTTRQTATMESNTLQNTQHICWDKVKHLETIPIIERLTRYFMTLHHLKRFDIISCIMTAYVKERF